MIASQTVTREGLLKYGAVDEFSLVERYHPVSLDWLEVFYEC